MAHRGHFTRWQALDHVPATAETVALRALWLDATYDLAAVRLLCLGDHDLTSLAVAVVNPAAQVAVVDVDDGVLRHIDDHGHDTVRCRWADLRFGLPESLRGWADLVVTDPPYTPDGVRLFLARGLQGLSAAHAARLVLGESAWLAGIGVTAGLLLALGLGRLARATLEGLLFGLPSNDVPTMAAATALMSVVALVAAYLPARRASRVDPMVALRIE